MAFVEVRNLSKTFKKGFINPQKSEILKDLSFSIELGNVLFLMGPNSSGKTTLLKILSTLVTPTSGEIRIGGFDLVKSPTQVRKLISFVNNEERSFFWRLSCFENLRFFGVLNNIQRKVLKATIEKMSIDLDFNEFLFTRFDLCSTGIKRRLGIARALLKNPQLLLLDEPTNSLDAQSSKILIDLLLKKISNREMAILYVTHRPEEQQFFGKQKAYIKNGIFQPNAS